MSNTIRTGYGGVQKINLQQDGSDDEPISVEEWTKVTEQIVAQVKTNLMAQYYQSMQAQIDAAAEGTTDAPDTDGDDAAATDPLYQSRQLSRPTARTAAETERQMIMVLARLNEMMNRLQAAATPSAGSAPAAGTAATTAATTTPTTPATPTPAAATTPTTTPAATTTTTPAPSTAAADATDATAETALGVKGEKAFTDTRDNALRMMRGALDNFKKSVGGEQSSYAKSEAGLKITSLEATLSRVEKMNSTEWANNGSRELSTAIARLSYDV